MQFSDWEPVYEAILADFGYDRTEDERARDVLAGLTDEFDLERLDVDGQRVAIAGAAGSLSDELSVIESSDAVFAASTAADQLLGVGVSIDCMVTDLDKTPTTARDLSRAGTPVAIHAHGDNIPALRRHVPTCYGAWILPTTQAWPTHPVINVGGFTDGDRAAFLADHLGADELVFPGWDFDDESVSPEKRRKLVWAERLLRWLEYRRGERFEVLDGRRSQIETSALPI